MGRILDDDAQEYRYYHEDCSINRSQYDNLLKPNNLLVKYLCTVSILSIHLHLHLLSSSMYDKTNTMTVEQDNKVQKIH